MKTKIDPIIVEMCRRERIPDEPVYMSDEFLLISLPHHLDATLERTPEAEAIEKDLYEFADRPEFKYDHWRTIIERFIEERGFRAIEEFYTYCDPDHNCLDQDFQFVMFEHDGEYYAIIEVHTGFDARVGFSDPRVFRVVDESYFLDWMIHVWCDTCDADLGDDDIAFDRENNAVICKHCGNEAFYHASAMGW